VLGGAVLGPEKALMPNNLLARRLKEQGFSRVRLSQETNLDSLTIDRILSGETASPRDSTKALIAQALDTTVENLWPDSFQGLHDSAAGVIAAKVFPSRTSIPIEFWRELFAGAQRQIDICVFGGTFLFDRMTGFKKLLKNASENGADIRFVVGDSGSLGVQQHGEEERFGSSLAGRCRLTLEHMQPLVSDTIQLRTSGATLYASLFRVDDTLVANHHIYGSPAGDNPCIFLDRESDPELWERYEESFQRIWNAAHQPLKEYRMNP